MALSSIGRFSALWVATVALLATSGCTQDDADPNDPTMNETSVSADDIDPCEALTPETIEQFHIPEGDAIDISDADGPACSWKKLAPGGNHTDVVLWVLEPGSHSDSVGTVTISGVDVSIWQIDTYDDDSGRYVVPCGDHELVINFLQNDGPLGAEAGLALAAADVIDAYGCAG